MLSTRRSVSQSASQTVSHPSIHPSMGQSSADCSRSSGQHPSTSRRCGPVSRWWHASSGGRARAPSLPSHDQPAIRQPSGPHQALIRPANRHSRACRCKLLPLSFDPSPARSPCTRREAYTPCGTCPECACALASRSNSTIRPVRVLVHVQGPCRSQSRPRTGTSLAACSSDRRMPCSCDPPAGGRCSDRPAATVGAGCVRWHRACAMGCDPMRCVLRSWPIWVAWAWTGGACTMNGWCVSIVPCSIGHLEAPDSQQQQQQHRQAHLHCNVHLVLSKQARLKVCPGLRRVMLDVVGGARCSGQLEQVSLGPCRASFLLHLGRAAWWWWW
ncbi:hypothetical protein BC831DRAFT_89122 [Entophlyctis helioformis]|nr:hypothetical protein BC831DRAFT_89122 [Entophlyctis helioformis]